MWNALREAAFVDDFRVDPEDLLAAVFGMGPEEVRDELIEPLLTELGLRVDGIDFTGFDFASIATVEDAALFLTRIAYAQTQGVRMPRFIDLHCQ